ncbi:MAG: HlyC/CorC family transporter [Pedosphaera sp.]|nr:HlyC/CorC family transporter [Pedosphaera sp.]MSU43187.1 HlyC/CorC family transporter [Pedosphaera sp.]
MDGAFWIAVGLKTLAVLLLVFLNGFFVAAEFALVKLRGTQLDGLIATGSRRARRVRRVLTNLDAYLSACQLGITLASLGLGWIGEPIFTELLKPVFDITRDGQPLLAAESPWRIWISFSVGFTCITVLHITAGEQAPKWLAIQRPLSTSLWVAYPLHWFHQLAYPFIWVLNRTALWMLRSVGIEIADGSEHGLSEEELRTLLTSKGGRSVQYGRDIVFNAFDLKHRVAREAMRPRREIVALNTEATMDECLATAERTRYSRFPLCEKGNLDATLGVVHIKDLYAQRNAARTGLDLQPFARKLIYVPESARLERLLHLFLDRKLHCAVVVNEYGDTAGLLTLENILEELVGQIQDEFDHETPLVKQVNDHTWLVAGELPVHDLAHLTGEILSDADVATVSGLITRRLGKFPKEGDQLRLGCHELRVEKVHGSQVEQARLTRVVDESSA